jgi:radical SAM modification target selenobiotic family peptide
MDKKKLKKILAGISMASLLATTSLTLFGCATDGKGTKVEDVKTSCSGGKSSCSVGGKTSCGG